jgi:hypothetical protein
MDVGACEEGPRVERFVVEYELCLRASRQSDMEGSQERDKQADESDIYEELPVEYSLAISIVSSHCCSP